MSTETRDKAPGENHGGSPAPVKRGRGCGTLFLVVMIVLAAAWGAGLGAFVWLLEDAKTTIAALEEFRPKIGSRVYDAHGRLLGEFTTESRQLVNLSEMPLHLQKAFVATEDDRFYEHKGVRPDAILSAVIYTLRTNRVRGGSTITQQLVRNIEALEVGQERTVRRKLREALSALLVERQFTKDEILELYLNQIFLGVSAHGVEAAAQQYFAKSCRDVTVGEAALLAGLTRAPNRNQPFAHPENARKRRDIVLGQMLENGFITEDVYAAALAESVEDSVVTPDERMQLHAERRTVWEPNRFKAPYFCEEVRRFVLHGLHDFAQDDVFQDGLEIHTTIDLDLQENAEDVLLTALDEFDADKRASLEKQGRLDEFMPVSGALVCLDNRSGCEGFVRAMVGGRDFSEDKFNKATQAKRQPGSSVKPFVWTAAIDSGMTPSDIVIDDRFQQFDGAGELWIPQNFGGEYHGPVTLRHALEKSINVVSIKLVERLGLPNVRSYLRRAGFRQPISDVVGLTIGLGSAETTVLDQAVCYSTFAHGGVHYEPVIVTEIRDRDGFPTYRYAANRSQAFDEDVAYVMTYLMQGVCEPGPGYYPTGWRTAELERPHAGKTGTTNDNRDAWFCGFTPQYTCVVWVGYDDNRPLGKGRNYTGGRIAAPIWTAFMKRAHEELPVAEFQKPHGVAFYPVDRQTGLFGGNYQEAFLAGTSPPTEMPAFVKDYLREKELEDLVLKGL